LSFFSSIRKKYYIGSLSRSDGYGLGLVNMKKEQFSFIILLICLLSVNDLFAQGSIDTSGFVSQPLKNTVDFYYRSIGDNSHLYNGSEYVSPVYRQDMHPYYKSILPINGFLLYDGIRYQDVPLAYDLMQEVVITYRHDQHYRVQLVNEKIGYFTLLGHLFVRIEQDSTHGSVIGSGFYDRLYDGHLKVYAKRRKKLEETIVQNVVNKQMIEEDRYYIEKEGNYFAIRNKRSLFAALKDKKKDVKKYLRKNKLKFKDDPENVIIQAAGYYDRIKSSI
jgi:hypothetical protein